MNRLHTVEATFTPTNPIEDESRPIYAVQRGERVLLVSVRVDARGENADATIALGDDQDESGYLTVTPSHFNPGDLPPTCGRASAVSVGRYLQDGRGNLYNTPAMLLAHFYTNQSAPAPGDAPTVTFRITMLREWPA